MLEPEEEPNRYLICLWNLSRATVPLLSFNFFVVQTPCPIFPFLPSIFHLVCLPSGSVWPSYSSRSCVLVPPLLRKEGTGSGYGGLYSIPIPVVQPDSMSAQNWRVPGDFGGSMSSMIPCTSYYQSPSSWPMLVTITNLQGDFLTPSGGPVYQTVYRSCTKSISISSGLSELGTTVWVSSRHTCSPTQARNDQHMVPRSLWRSLLLAFWHHLSSAWWPIPSFDLPYPAKCPLWTPLTDLIPQGDTSESDLEMVGHSVWMWLDIWYQSWRNGSRKRSRVF